jgi:hypothetical protein
MINLNDNTHEIKYFGGTTTVLSLTVYVEKKFLVSKSIFTFDFKKTQYFQGTFCSNGLVKIFDIYNQELIEQFNVYQFDDTQ